MPPSESRKKALNAANQDALDRLYDKCEQASTAHSSKYVFAVRKAAKSLQQCPTEILTIKDAKALHGVGDSLARIILPNLMNSRKPIPRVPSTISTTSSTTNDTDSNQYPETLEPGKGTRDPPQPDRKLNAPRPSEKLKAYFSAVKRSEALFLPPENWRVVLLVDGREHGWEKVLADLQMSGVPSEKRNLPIGDMAWIARSGSIEVMLGTIIERKEVNDLASSLFGTRYKEQRLRLQHCGLPQVFLLVEGDTKNVSNCSHESLSMAMMETRVQLGFQVVQTRHLEETILFLKNVHRRILQRSFPSAFSDSETQISLPSFSSQGSKLGRTRLTVKRRHKRHRLSFEEMVFDNAPVPPFAMSRFLTYDELKCKVEKDREEGTKTVGRIFCRMLKQIPRISNTTIPSLVLAYPTPNALFRALGGLNESEGKALLGDLDTGSQKVGEQKAFEVYLAFTSGKVVDGVNRAQSFAAMEQSHVGKGGRGSEYEKECNIQQVDPPAAYMNVESDSSNKSTRTPERKAQSKHDKHAPKIEPVETECSRIEFGTVDQRVSPRNKKGQLPNPLGIMSRPFSGLARRPTKSRCVDDLDATLAFMSKEIEGFCNSDTSEDDDSMHLLVSRTCFKPPSHSDDEETFELYLRRRQRQRRPPTRCVSVSDNETAKPLLDPEVIELSD